MKHHSSFSAVRHEGSRVTMDFYQQPYYRINKILLRLIGRWPYQANLESRGFACFIWFLFATQVTPQLLALVKARDDWDTLLECISPLTFIAICAMKYICSAWNSEKMLKLLIRIRADWQVWSRDPEVEILHKYAEQGRKITIVYTVMMYSCGIIFVTQPVIPKIINVFSENSSEPGEFPFPVDYYSLDMQKYYFYIIMYTYITTSGGLITTIASDVMFMVHVQHGCGLFAALGQKLERIGKNERSIEENENVSNTRDMDFERLVTCIDRHNEAIEFAKLVESTYTWCLFFIIGFNMLIISIIGLQIVKRSNGPEETMRFIVWLITDTTHIFIESYMSQILMDHSIGIRDYIQNGKWYMLSLKAQKLLNFMLMRCNIPCKLTAGKVALMSMEFFQGFLKTSISYFTLFRSL